MLGKLLLAVGLTVVAFGPARASAQESASEPEPAPSAVDDAQAATLDAEARSLFDAGTTAYHAGRYEAALGYFQGSYELSHRPELLFNIGNAAERARQDSVALEAYERYLELAPEAPQHTLARTRLEFLRGQLDESTPDEAGDGSDATDDSSRDTPAEPAPSGSDAGPAPWIVFGIGAAAAITGAVLLALGLADQASVEDPAAGARLADTQDAYERGPTLLTAGAVMLPVGLVAIVAGVIWAAVGGGEDAEQASVRPHGLGVEVTF